MSVQRMREDLERLESVMRDTSTGGDVPFGSRLMRAGLSKVRDDLKAQIDFAQRAHMDVHLNGPSIVEHEVKISALAKFLNSLQESIAAVAQALAGKATSRSAIPGPLRDVTALWLSSVQPGSFGATLRAPAAASDNSLVLQSGGPSLLDQAVVRVMEIVDLAEVSEAVDDSIINSVLPLGSRAFKHLSDLASAVVDEQVEVSIKWQSPSSESRSANLSGHAARRLTEVLGRNRVSESQETIQGRLGTVSDIRNRIELQLLDGSIIRAMVVEEVVPYLAQFFTRTVTATFNITTVRSFVTGVETRSYTLVDLDGGIYRRPIDDMDLDDLDLPLRPKDDQGPGDSGSRGAAG